MSGLVLLLLGAGGAWAIGRRRLHDRMSRALSLAAALARRNAELREARAAAEAAQREVQRANEAKTRFLALMSHELRTPLNVIGGYAELIQLGLRGPVTEDQRADLLRIQRSKRHLITIIDELLDHACIEAGKLAVGLRPVSLRSVLEEVEALMALDVASKDLRLESAGCDTDAVVLADHEKLCRVLASLLANAIRFTPPGGAIRLECETRPDAVRVRVVDTGIGIPADRLEAIFEPFTQVDDGLTRRTGGTGLGLTISREFVAAMGGRIDVSSVVGTGSTFTVTLPRGSGGAAPSAVPAA